MKNLIFWKGMEDVSFKQTDEGDVFYPYGTFGAGYVVGEDQKARLLSALRSYYSAGTVFVVMGAFAGGFHNYHALLFLIPAIVMVTTYYQLQCRKILHGAPRSRHRLSFAEAQRTRARRMSNARLIIALVIGVSLVVLFFFFTLLVLTKYDHVTFAIAASGLLFFSFCLALVGRLAWFKWGEMKSP